MTLLITIEAIAIGVLALLVVGLLRSHAEILRALHDLGAGEAAEPIAPARQPGMPPAAARASAIGPATDIVGTTVRGGSAKVGVQGVDHATLLAFLSSGCRACAVFWDEFAANDVPLPGTNVRPVIVTKGAAEESRSQVERLAPPGVSTIMSSPAWQDYSVPATPYFVLVDGPSGSVVGEGTAGTWPHVVSLLSQAMADAGVTGNGGGGTRRGELLERSASRIDRDLAAAGIHPGHPSLYPDRDVPDGAEGSR